MKEAVDQQDLLQIYSVYEKLKGANKSATSASSKSKPSTATPSSDPSATTEESESLKKQGNAAMQRKDHATAIDFYTKAINISPANPIYLSNRAAAYSGSGNHKDAATDAELAVAADPKYTKAWSRLGLAKFVLGDTRASMEAYQKGLEAEQASGGTPSEAMKKGFETAKRKVEEQEKEGKEAAELPSEAVDDAAGGSRGAGGMPDLGGMFGGGGGGMPDLGGMMNNPMFAQMAQNLMSDPDKMKGLMENPQIKQMAEKFGLGGAGGGGGGAGRGSGGGGGGGTPDLASLMSDPSLQEM